MKIVYFGKPYSFTHVAALRGFGEKHKYVSGNTIAETIEKIKSDPKSIGIIPIENTTGGIIYDSVDVLCSGSYLESDLTILEELELSIKLFLLSKNKIKLSQIKKIYSHEYALKRSESWIDTHLSKKVDVQRVVSTSDAAQRARKEKYSSAIASAEAARHYGLTKLREIDVSGKRNLTRFFVIGKNGKKSI